MKTALKRFVFLVLTITSASASVDIRQVPTPQQRRELIDKGWSNAREEIAVALCQAYAPSRSTLAGSTQSPAFLAWLHLWQWFDVFAKPQSVFLERYIRQYVVADAEGKLVALGPGVEMPDELHPLTDEEWQKVAQDTDTAAKALQLQPIDGSRSMGDAIGAEFANVLIGDDVFSREFFETLSPRDYVPGVLQNLKEIWQAKPESYKTYKNLALALAVVFDQPSPAFWPHGQVDPQKVPREELSVADRFDFWVKGNESRRFLLDIRKLPASQSKFIVDALASRKELEWAQNNIPFPRKDFARAFSYIQYDTGRLRTQKYDWPGQTYTLEEIRRHGGICVDQAYFAMLSGKAKGLPTLFFVGQGSNGGHAWFGYLKSDDRWDLDCGRYANQNYAVGEAYDPQTWLPISDHELTYLAARFRETPAYLASLNELTMGKVLEERGDTAKAEKAFEGAISVCPLYDEAWQARTAFLHRTNAPPQVLKLHLEAGLKQFTNNEDLRTGYQQELAWLARSRGDNKTAEEYESRIVQQNRRGRTDISVTAAAQKLNALLAKKDFALTDASREYRSLVMQLGRQSGGSFYYEIVLPYVKALLARGTKEDLKEAANAIEFAGKRLQPERGSILARDLSALWEKVKKAEKP